MVRKVYGFRGIVFRVSDINLPAFGREYVYNKDDDLHRLVMLHHGRAVILEIV
jgi:hypothetical protein